MTEVPAKNEANVIERQDSPESIDEPAAPGTGTSGAIIHDELAESILKSRPSASLESAPVVWSRVCMDVKLLWQVLRMWKGATWRHVHQ